MIGPLVPAVNEEESGATGRVMGPARGIFRCTTPECGAGCEPVDHSPSAWETGSSRCRSLGRAWLEWLFVRDGPDATG